MLTRADMRGYQRRATSFVKRRRYAALLIDMGLGKTIIMLTAILDLLKSGEIDSVLIVAPIRVIQAVWRQEAREWMHTRGIKFALVHGDPATRMAALRTPAHIHMINPEGLKWLRQVMGRRAWPWSMLVVDESTEFAAPKMTVRFRSLRRGLRHFKRRYVMTGTPTPRSLLQIWPQMFIADMGASLGQRFGDFKTNHFYKTGYMGHQFEPKEGSEDVIAEAMSRRVVRLAAEDWIEVPELVTVPIWVDLPHAARVLYEQLEEEMFLEFNGFGSDDEEAVAETAAALSMKCRQLSNGFIFTSNIETGARSWRPIHDAKIEALRELSRETYEQPMLVAYTFKPDVPRIKAAMPQYVVFDKGKTETLVDQWNRGKLPGLILHPANSKYGLNMQKGGNLLTWFGATFSRLQYDQLIGRLRRSGQTKRVYTYLILARNTVDEIVLETLTNHGVRQARLGNLFQKYYERRLTRSGI